jgi:hypothetical protein
MKRSALVAFALLACGLACGRGTAAPVVFWSSDGLAPGDVALVYGGGLRSVREVQVWRVPDDSAVSVRALEAPATASRQPSLQATDGSLKFRVPPTLPPGVFAARPDGGDVTALNRPQLWFVQPERLVPGLAENEAAPGSRIHLIGKDFLLPGDVGTPMLELRPVGGGAPRRFAPSASEKFSVRAALPPDLNEGTYELRGSNGFGGAAGWSDPLTVVIRSPATWPSRVFDVKEFGAKGDDTTDDTVAIRDALAAAEANGGGVVLFPWGTYRLTDWIRIPPRTILRGEDRDASVLKWPVDEPLTEADVAHAAIYGDGSYGIEDLSLIARKVRTILHDLSSSKWVVTDLKPRIRTDGSRDVFIRHVAFHHWLLCGHPDRNATLWAKFYTAPGSTFSNSFGSIRNFEVSDCLFQGGNQQFSNIRNARLLRNSFSNGMGSCSTCLGAGASHVVAEGNDLRCSSSWDSGMIGLNRIYSARNVSRSFVQGDREAMRLDVGALPATPPGAVPKGMHPIAARNIAWLGPPTEAAGVTVTIGDIKAEGGEFVGKTVVVLDGPGAWQFREIVRNSRTEFTIDTPWDVPPTRQSIVGLWDLSRYMIVHRCEAFDASALSQLDGSFYELIVDRCTAERSQGIWGQCGWFVQYRDNVIRYGHTYHPQIGIPGVNPERNAPFGFSGLVDGNLRITKDGSAQYGVPGGKPLFVKDVLGRTVPGVRGCIVRGNELSYNQRIVLAPDDNPVRKLGRNEFLRMVDGVIERNTIRHGAVGINVGPTAEGVVLRDNLCDDVATPLLVAPAAVLELDPPRFVRRPGAKK